LAVLVLAIAGMLVAWIMKYTKTIVKVGQPFALGHSLQLYNGSQRLLQGAQVAGETVVVVEEVF
jgi:hypothetical protein